MKNTTDQLRICGKCEFLAETIPSKMKWLKRRSFFCNYEQRGNGVKVGLKSKCFVGLKK